MSADMFRPLETLSRRQRQLTPAPFARHLLAVVRRLFPEAQRVAILWTHRATIYPSIDPAVDCWGVERDARTYSGPHPIIAHPPCGPWGKYSSASHESREDGRIAMELVHRWGGIVEQPVGSVLFRECGQPFAEIASVEQGRFGHLARKPTLLYFWRWPGMIL